ncbi:MAG: hypothetical protein ACLSVD_07185 [Eggerthellaceae bacterium]
MRRRASIAQGIERERDLLFECGERPSVIDTTSMLPPQLRSTIRALFAPGEERAGLSVTVYSFGFKHGAPLAPTWSWTCASCRTLLRTAAEPHGLDKPVSDFVLYRPETEEFQGSGALLIASCPATWPRANSSWPSPWMHGRPAPQRRAGRVHGRLPQGEGLPREHRAPRPVAG